MKSEHLLLSLSMLASITLGGFDAAGATNSSQDLPPILLRGYGEVSGQFRPSENGSTLAVASEDEAKAALVQAKFLSDMQVQSEVFEKVLSVDGEEVFAISAADQGYVVALRKGKEVLLLASPTRDGIQALVAANLPGDSRPSAEVPMWLDRWDRFGFRFYYRPWELPRDVKAEDYDITTEFEFAETNNRAGFVFWANQEQVDTAEGLTNERWWNWAAAAAKEKNLPVGLNLMTGGAGHSWLTNRYRHEMMQPMPGVQGSYHRLMAPHLGGNGFVSWNSLEAKDAQLGALQDILRRYVDSPNLTTVLEPHGELRHGNHDIFLEYGPVADAGFQRFLQQKYDSLESVNKAWGSDFQAWDEVRVPEVASFLGWSDDALDLAGEWRVNYEDFADGKDYSVRELMHSSIRNQKVPTEGTPDGWMDETFDDADWTTIHSPGDHRTIFMPQRPAVFRRTFELPADWKREDRVWLYVWDLSVATHDVVRVAVNGVQVGEDTLRHTIPHWGAFDVTDALRSGSNQLSIRLPKGFIAYRVYLSKEEPRQYPNLGPHGNARWVDFMEWIGWSRVEIARRGMEMIRGVDPNRQIDLMAPGFYADDIKELALKYGGNFKNTGYMGSFWADDLPAMMRGAGLPFSLEPSAPARNLERFKRQLGLYATEGIQGIDYFIHIGSILWDDEMRQHFEENQRLIQLFGKYHAPTAEIAALYPTRGTALTGYPWGEDPNTNLGAGYWNWNVRANLRGRYESDALTESSFESGDAARYRVVIDTNTSIIDEPLLDAIEQYVRDGGTFVTFVQTGRHTSIEKDTWPISRLTGYRVTHIDPLDSDGEVLQPRSMRPAPDQEVFSGNWRRVPANGLTLEKIEPDAQDLMLWQDGGVAVGMRRLGKGVIIQVGCKFSGRSIPDRIEPPSSVERPTVDVPTSANEALTTLLTSILKWKNVEPAVPVLSPPNRNVLVRHYESNNGLYDMWIAWNQSDSDSVETEIQLQVDHPPGWAIQVRDNERVEVVDGKLPVKLSPCEQVAYLTPRDQIASAPVEWFELQRDWWRGVAHLEEKPKELPTSPHRFSVDLGNDWSFRALADGEDAVPFSQADVDTADWETLPLGIWSLPDKREVKRAILRREFTVPETWENGEVSLWIQSWMTDTFVDRGRIWLDGELISDWSPHGLIDANPDGVLKPGSRHVLAVEIEGKGSLVGAHGSAWLWFWPKAESSIDLAGEWTPSDDALFYSEPVNLPGSVGTQLLRRTFDLPSDFDGRNGVIHIEADAPVLGVLVNGHWVRRFHHLFEPRFHLNITPWLKFGEENQIELVGNQGSLKGSIDRVTLELYDPEVYP